MQVRPEPLLTAGGRQLEVTCHWTGRCRFEPGLGCSSHPVPLPRTRFMSEKVAWRGCSCQTSHQCWWMSTPAVFALNQTHEKVALATQQSMVKMRTDGGTRQPGQSSGSSADLCTTLGKLLLWSFSQFPRLHSGSNNSVYLWEFSSANFCKAHIKHSKY